MGRSILVTGATGKVGSSVVEELSALGATFRACSRGGEALDRLGALGHDVARIDLSDPESVEEAVDGVDVIFLLSAQHPDQAGQQGSVVRAASAAGVEHIVKLSGGSYLTSETSGSWVGRAHWQTEREIAESGIDHTFLRPSYFMQNLLLLADPVAAGVLPVPIPAGRSRLSMIDSRDIGAAAARILVEPGPHRERAYELSGPEATDFSSVSDRMTAILGHPVEHVTPPIEAAVGCLRDRGAPEWVQSHYSQTMEILGSDPRVAAVTDDVERITGRPPRSLDDFLRDHAGAFVSEPQLQGLA